ncbi:MAG: fumarylacetoacetate hydrolase family protein [Rhodococcus sp. (in: high G+C Gram-positive bacteria)]|nr:MAG: fumarylacetoacetate hydrolase family protein [Rhodococcus sp. (in: high G+C Gram-positive bacteria)]
MRVANQAGRLQVVADGIAVDVEAASGGRFSAEPQQIFDRWDEFTAWATTVDFTGGAPLVESELGAPVPRPGQIFAVGVNYADHVEESGLTLPDAPFVFTKFPASITGPYDTIEHPGGSVDFEVELVAVIGKEARNVPVSEGWEYVAGLTLGQDLSERDLQLSGPPPQQFNLGKSFAGFAPIGPLLVTPDEFADPDDIEVSTVLSGELMQHSRTRHLIFPIPVLVSYLSSILPLRPGDLIFTGTPSGIGFTRDPKRLIGVDDELVSRADTIGEMRHRFTAATRPHPLTTVSRSTNHV